MVRIDQWYHFIKVKLMALSGVGGKTFLKIATIGILGFGGFKGCDFREDGKDQEKINLAFQAMQYRIDSLENARERHGHDRVTVTGAETYYSHGNPVHIQERTTFSEMINQEKLQYTAKKTPLEKSKEAFRKEALAMGVLLGLLGWAGFGAAAEVKSGRRLPP